MLSDRKKERSATGEGLETVAAPAASTATAEVKPTTHPSQRCGGLCSATALVVALCALACGVTVFGLMRGRARVTASGADAFFEEDRVGATAAAFAPWQHAIPLIGKHWIVEAEGCDGATINDEAKMVRIVRDAVAAANASLVTVISKGFDHMGTTILALLAESHVGIHTWPQYGYAATDIFTCGHVAQPQIAVQHMIKEWKCNESQTRYVFMHRGGAIASSDLRTLEENNDNKELIAYIKTPYQKAHIFWTEVSGLHFFLDGTTQSVESDERIYHESLVHPAMLAHPLPRNVVILGAAEGAVLREVLWGHKSVEHVTMVEIDGEVVALCREFMPTWSDGAFEDSRVKLFIGDAKEYVDTRLQDHTIDVVIMDLVDPMVGVPNNFAPYQLEFFKTIAKRLTANGVFVMQAGQVDEDDEQGIVPFAKLLHELHNAFPFVSYYTKYIRSMDGFWGFIIACVDKKCNSSPIVDPEAAPAQVDKLVASRMSSKHANRLNSFDGESNRGMFSVNRETRAALAALDIQHERTIRHA